MTTTVQLKQLADAIATAMKQRDTTVAGHTTSISSIASDVASLQASTAGIDDSAAAASAAWSGSKVQAEITSAVNALVASAPADLNTLSELAAELAANDSALGGVIAGQAIRVSVGAAQTFTDAQKAQARANIGCLDEPAVYTCVAEVTGDVSEDLGAYFSSALAA